MKKSIFLTVAILLIASIVRAQGFGLGIKAGANYNKISGLELTQGYVPGFHLGVFMEMGGKTVGFQPELLFSQIGTKISNDTASAFHSDQKINLTYLTIPLLVRLNLGKALSLHAGPQFGILMNKSKNLLENGQEAFKSGDFAMDFGAQLGFGIFRVYGRYCIGLSNISDLQNEANWKNQVFQLGVGVKIL
jgi:hypothetical protein